MEELSGRVAAITGAGGGIGSALALACADAGMDVALADVEAGKAEAVAEEVRKRGRRALAASVDVRRPEASRPSPSAPSPSSAAASCSATTRASSSSGLTHQRSLEDWQWVLSVNLWAPSTAYAPSCRA